MLSVSPVCSLPVLLFDFLLSCRSTTGRWDPGAYCMTEAGWLWMETAYVWVRRESRVYVSFAHESIWLQTNCSCRRQVRVCHCLSQRKFIPPDFFNKILFVYSLFTLQGWRSFRSLWKTKSTPASACVRVKSVATGERLAARRLVSSCGKCYGRLFVPYCSQLSHTYVISHLSFILGS